MKFMYINAVSDLLLHFHIFKLHYTLFDEIDINKSINRN